MRINEIIKSIKFESQYRINVGFIGRILTITIVTIVSTIVSTIGNQFEAWKKKTLSCSTVAAPHSEWQHFGASRHLLSPLPHALQPHAEHLYAGRPVDRTR